MIKHLYPSALGILLWTLAPCTSNAQILNRIKNKLNERGTATSDQASMQSGGPRETSVQSSGVKMLVTKKRYANFEQATPFAINEVSDGDSLWLYIKSTKPFKELVDTRRMPQEDGSVLKSQTLMLRLGPNDTSGPYNDYCSLCFGTGKECKYDDRVDPAALESNEVRLSLTRFDPKGSSRVVLSTVGAGMPGNWDNQIRLYLNGQEKPAAVVRLNCKVEDGIAKYKKMWLTYKDLQSKGDEGTNELPEQVDYTDAGLRSAILQKTKQKGISIVRFFFTQNGWTEIEESSISRYRYVTAAFTYKKGTKCMYGLAYVRQEYALGSATFGPSSISFQALDSPLACDKM